jgi:hypothetical protein
MNAKVFPPMTDIAGSEAENSNLLMQETLPGDQANASDY